MIIDDKVKQEIAEVVERYFNILIIKVAGRGLLPDEKIQELVNLGIIPMEAIEEGLIDDAYFIGRFRPVLKPKKISLNTLRNQKREFLTSDVEEYALKHVRDSAGGYITKLRDMFSSNVKNLIDRKNLDYRNKVLTEKVRPILAEGIQKRKTVSAIASELRDSTKDSFRNFERIVTTELTNAVNLGAQDAMIKDSPDKSPKDIYVAKIVKSDAALCALCKKFYVNGSGNPKVYRLSELQKNGDNYGRKASDAKPVIGTVHPNCRCQLIRVEDGWDFDKTGELIFVGTGKEKWRKDL